MGCSKALGVLAVVVATSGPYGVSEARTSGAAAQAEAKPKKLKPGTELTLADLAWPPTTRSAEATSSIEVLRAIGRGKRHGKLARGTRVRWKRIVAASDGCRAYLEIEPRGFVCAKQLAPSDLPPAPAAHVAPAAIVARTLAKLQFGVGPRGAHAYDTTSAIRRAEPDRKLVGWKFLHGTIKAVAVVGDALFIKTIEGYVAAADLIARPASTFIGTSVTASTAWPLGWVVPKKLDARVVTRAAPSRTAAPVRELAFRTQVPVLASDGAFARIGPNEWIARDELAVAVTSQRPDGVRPDERWLDVDLDENVLVAYAGDQPVFATLVSTGFGSTPTSLHRITKKHALMRLVSPEVATGTWNLPDVPFMMEFRKYYGLHGAYWHDSFGKRRGHGCVNLSPRDAQFLYEWTLPSVPPGWHESSAADGEGTPIRIRDRKHPNPPWTDFDAPPPVKLREPEETIAAEPAAPATEPSPASDP